MAAGAFFLALMSAFVKAAGPRFPTMELVLARAVMIVLFTAPYLMLKGTSPWGVRRGLLVLRGLLGFLALSCLYFALLRAPLAEVTVIHYTNPIFTAVIAVVALGELMRGREVGLAVASLAGVVLVARPGFLFGDMAAALDPLGVTAALTAAVLTGGAYVSVRKLGTTEDPMVIVFYFGLVGVLGSLPFVIQDSVLPTAEEWGYLLGLGISGQIAQIFLTLGLRAERAGRAMAVGYLQIVFAAALGMLFFQEFPDLWSILGALVIVASTWFLATARVIS
jgi:drug/metabolite transporter (DMT)-like permease